LYDQRWMADGESLECCTVELYELAVANCADTRTSGRSGQQAELSDGFAGCNLAE
jgi:hypothetical protein